ncbi:hypothetical protein AI27_08845 [Sphingomonas sp. BHC-A]|nr:hypothetical protein AI27_08845 [Sphingomonas sp. BHC-A]
MIELLATVVGRKAAKPVFGALCALLVLAVLSIGYCSLRGGAADQAEQTTRSSDAIANAAQGAVTDIMNQSKAETAIDAGVAATKEEIGHAQDPAAIRAAVARNVCLRPEYRSDPACAVR